MKIKNEMKIQQQQKQHKNLLGGSPMQSNIAGSFWFFDLKKWLQKCY